MSEQDMSDRLYFPAQVRAVGDAARIATLTELLRNGRALDASVLAEHPPFFWRALISNTRVDSHFTHMLLSSLRNYAREAAEGVAFLPGHDRYHLPIGGSLTGELSEEGSEANLRADFFTLTGLEIGSINTSSLVAGIRGGLTRDVSVGIHGGKWLCDICGQNYFDYRRCSHFAGFTYEEEKDGVIRQILCTVGVDDAHLSEVSGVFDGSTPGAMIEKVYEAALSGALSVDDVRHAEVVYRLDKATTERMLALPALQKRHAGVDTEQSGQKPREEERMNAEQFGQLTSTLIRAGVLTEEQRETATEAEALAAADKLAKRVAELEPRAADGDTYRNDLVADALAEGVRANGQDFDGGTYEATLRASPLKVVKRMRDDWKRAGDARFVGGRQTTEGDGQAAQTARVPLVADSAYRS
jgi:hypothetical protein